LIEALHKRCLVRKRGLRDAKGNDDWYNKAAEEISSDEGGKEVNREAH
jgi:hypothetical protein